MAKEPAYITITKWLRDEVDRRGPKALMPTVAEVCARFNINGVQTVRNAYEPLIDEGLVERIGSPRRWAVVDRGQEAGAAKDSEPTLAELEATLARALELVRELRLMT